MRFPWKIPLGILGLFFYGVAVFRVVAVHSLAMANLWALASLAGIFAASWLWGRWWINGLAVAATNLILIGGWGIPGLGLLLVTAAFGILLGWWVTVSPRWPPRVSQSLLAVAALALMGICLGVLMQMRGSAGASTAPYVLTVLYLCTPAWEWALILVVLSQSNHIGRFFKENYRATIGYVTAGFAVGLGAILINILMVLIESRGLHISIRSNNPFVFAPGLIHGQWLPRLLVVIGGVILAPLAEEALFRGILFKSLSFRWGYPIGTLASALIFGLAHLDLSLLVPLALSGIIFNELYRRTNSLIPSMVAHATLNSIALLGALAMGGTLHF